MASITQTNLGCLKALQTRQTPDFLSFKRIEQHDSDNQKNRIKENK
jgi:hypothetical protein